MGWKAAAPLSAELGAGILLAAGKKRGFCRHADPEPALLRF
jgi:hypothetical protein